MPARDTYRIEATIQGEYDDAPTWARTFEEYLAPGQPAEATMSSVMRGAALELHGESGEFRSEVAILEALDGARSATIAESVGPATRDLILGRLWQLADALNIEWYGAGRPAASDESLSPGGDRP